MTGGLRDPEGPPRPDRTASRPICVPCTMRASSQTRHGPRVSNASVSARSWGYLDSTNGPLRQLREPAGGGASGETPGDLLGR